MFSVFTGFLQSAPNEDAEMSGVLDAAENAAKPTERDSKFDTVSKKISQVSTHLQRAAYNTLSPVIGKKSAKNIAMITPVLAGGVGGMGTMYILPYLLHVAVITIVCIFIINRLGNK